MRTVQFRPLAQKIKLKLQRKRPHEQFYWPYGSPYPAGAGLSAAIERDGAGRKDWWGAWGVCTNQDPAALGVVEGVEGGEHAEAAAAVADDEADGAAPPEAGLAGRVLGGYVEVLVQIALDAPAPASLHACCCCSLALPLCVSNVNRKGTVQT